MKLSPKLISSFAASWSIRWSRFCIAGRDTSTGAMVEQAVIAGLLSVAVNLFWQSCLPNGQVG